jgi:hypothetical protein
VAMDSANRARSIRPARGRPGPEPLPPSGPGGDQADRLLVGLERPRPAGDPQVEGQALGELAGEQRVRRPGRPRPGRRGPGQRPGRRRRRWLACLARPGPAARPCHARGRPAASWQRSHSSRARSNWRWASAKA